MRGRTYTSKNKLDAALLRRQGHSYSSISKRLGIPTSTLATWLVTSSDNLFTKKDQLAHLAKIRPLASAARRKQKQERLIKVVKRAHRQVVDAPTKNKMFQKTILAMLYWAEGAKHEKVSGLRFVNTDPSMLQLYLSLLRKCYDIDTEKIRVRLHLHYYHKKSDVRDFWASALDVPQVKDAAVFVKKRSKQRRFRKNFMGICFIYYPDSGIREELLAIGQELHKHYISSS